MRGFARFWYDFLIGDDWGVAAGVVAGVALTDVVAHQHVTAWWLMPVAVGVLLYVSLWRAARPRGLPRGRSRSTS